MVKILTYNIFFKAMESKNPVDKCGVKCLSNVSDFIQSNGPYDFVCLQEATKWKQIQKQTPILSLMTAISYREHFEEIVTFYNNKFILDSENNLLSGHMEDRNRPFLILFFNKKICIINLHAGHHGDAYKLTSYIKTLLLKIPNSEIFNQKLQTYDIIIAGDFNTTFRSGKFTLLNRQLINFNTKASCCDNTLQINQHSPFDHILTTITNSKFINKVFPISNASDHLPLITIIKKNNNNLINTFHNQKAGQSLLSQLRFIVINKNPTKSNIRLSMKIIKKMQLNGYIFNQTIYRYLSKIALLKKLENQIDNNKLAIKISESKRQLQINLIKLIANINIYY